MKYGKYFFVFVVVLVAAICVGLNSIVVEEEGLFPKIFLKEDEVAIFGYGSLMLPESFEQTLGRKCVMQPVTCQLSGWKRSWSVKYPNSHFYFKVREYTIYPDNIIYLNIEEDRSQKLNGVLWVIKKDELRGFDEREAVYDRICVNDLLEGVEVVGGDVYTYKAKPQFLVKDVKSCRDGAIRWSYVMMLRNALSFWGEEFIGGYQKTTEQIPLSILIDDKKRV